MKDRCSNSNHVAYSRYGGRGITVCEEWLNDATTFMLWGKANGYADDLQLDRIDNDSGYSPENCQWVPSKANSRNKSNNVIVFAFGESKCIAEWGDDPRLIVSPFTLRTRLNSGWNAEDAITRPAQIHKKRPSQE